MFLDYLVNGFVVGFIIGIPVGPVSIIVIQQLLSKGRMHGMVCGLGSASADAVYGFIFAFGLTYVSDFIIKNKYPIQILGSLLLLLMGAHIILSNLKHSKKARNQKTFTGSFASTFICSATNPVTLISYATLLAGFGFKDTTHSSFLSSCIVLGVFFGAFIWWIALAVSIGFLRNKLTLSKIYRLNSVLGIFILCIAVFILVSRISSIL